MRRKGQAPFSRRAIGAKLEKSYTTMDNGDKGAHLSNSDPLYNSMQRGLSDGMNHIAKSILHHHGGGIISGGNSHRGGLIGFDSGGDMISSTGELQTRREDIPLRPLMLNGTTGQQTNGTEKKILNNYE